MTSDELKAKIAAAEARIESLHAQDLEASRARHERYEEREALHNRIDRWREDIVFATTPGALAWLIKVADAGHLTLPRDTLTPEDRAAIKALDGVRLVASCWTEDALEVSSNDFGADAYYRRRGVGQLFSLALGAPRVRVGA